MLTSPCPEGRSPIRSAARLRAALILATSLAASAVAVNEAAAGASRAPRGFTDTEGGFSSTNCIGTWRDYNCVSRWGPATDPYVRLVPQPLGEAEQARAIARDHRWLARCRPVIRHDIYGVARYLYAEPGCEFGVGAD